MKLKSKLLFVLIIGIAFGGNGAFAKESESGPTKKQYPNKYYYKQFQEVFEKIQRDYVQEADLQKMTDDAIDGMLKSLDPYSGYYVDEDLEFFVNQTDGEFGGIGIEITPENGAVKVISPIDDLPAYRAGIRAGDYIVGVNGELVSNIGFNKAVQEMRGEPGTELNLLVLKGDKDTPEEMTLKRERVVIEPIKYDFEHDKEIGGVAYLRISSFNGKTIDELKKAVAEVTKKAKKNNTSIKGIILDLRSNPGGLLDQAAFVSEYFLDHGVIVTAKGRNQNQEIIHTASRFAEKAPNVPMVVLINSGSASASEIVAGALQDNKRAIIVGTTSYGKGLVQTFSPVSDRAAVKITTQKYFTPSGRSINAEGIEPDIYIEPAKVEYSHKDEKDKRFTSSTIKAYLKKYNKSEKDSDESSKSGDKVETKDSEDHVKNSKDTTKRSKDSAMDSKDSNKNKANQQQDGDKKSVNTEHEMSDKYKEDYQYARAYDLIRGLIISANTYGKQDCPTNSKSNP